MFWTLTRDPEETKRIGKNLGQSVSAGSIVALTGELGSGKTTLVQGIGQGLEVNCLIKSPSFVIINEYSGRIPLYHFDLYRLDSAPELSYLGYEEYFYERGGVVVIEWAQKIRNLLPEEYLDIDIRIVGPSKRKIRVQAYGSLYQGIVKYLRTVSSRSA